MRADVVGASGVRGKHREIGAGFGPLIQPCIQPRRWTRIGPGRKRIQWVAFGERSGPVYLLLEFLDHSKFRVPVAEEEPMRVVQTLFPYVGLHRGKPQLFGQVLQVRRPSFPVSR